MDHDFPIDQFIAKAAALRRFDGVAAGMRIPMYEVSLQDTHVGLVHSRYQAMGLEPDFGVHAMRASRVKNPSKLRAWSVGST